MKKSTENMNVEECLKHIEDNKHLTLQKLIALPFEKLYELKHYYSDLYSSAEEIGYTESFKVNSLHCRIITDAIQIKRGNEEQAWDYLS